MKIISAIKAIEPLLVVFSTAVIIATLIVYPEPKNLKVGLALLGTLVAMYAPQSFVFWGVLGLILVPKSAGSLMNTADIAIVMMVCVTYLREIIGQNYLISFSNVIENSFLKVSTIILTVYIIYLVIAITIGGPGINKHISFVVGTGSALLMANMVIGYIQDRARLNQIKKYLLIILLINLTGGLISFFFPDVVFLFTGESQGTKMVGSGADRALRLGGVFFFWEAYAEYLMMFLVFLSGWLIGGGVKGGRWQLVALALILLTGIELLLTNTRGAVVIAVLGVVLTVFMFSKKNIWSKISLFCVVLLIIGSVFSLAQFNEKVSLLNRLDDFAEIEQTNYGPLPKDRNKVWLSGIDHIIEHSGLGTGPSLYPQTFYLPERYGHIPWPHNLILIILCTVGIPGFLAYFYMLFRMVKLKNYINRFSSAEIRLFYNLGLFTFALFLLDGMKYDGWLRSSNNYFYFIWLLIAILFSAETLDDEK